MGDVPVLSHCFSLRNLRITATRVLEHSREEEKFNIPTAGSPLGAFLLATSLRRRKMPMYIFSRTVVITVNYTIEFRKLFVATAY